MTSHDLPDGFDFSVVEKSVGPTMYYPEKDIHNLLSRLSRLWVPGGDWLSKQGAPLLPRESPRVAEEDYPRLQPLWLSEKN